MSFNEWPAPTVKTPVLAAGALAGSVPSEQGQPVAPIVQAFIAASERLPGERLEESEESSGGGSFQSPGVAFALLSNNEMESAPRPCGCRNQSVCPQCAPALFRSGEATDPNTKQQGATILAAMAAARASEQAQSAALSKLPKAQQQESINVPSCLCLAGEACATCRPD